MGSEWSTDNDKRTTYNKIPGAVQALTTLSWVTRTTPKMESLEKPFTLRQATAGKDMTARAPLGAPPRRWTPSALLCTEVFGGAMGCSVQRKKEWLDYWAPYSSIVPHRRCYGCSQECWARAQTLMGKVSGFPSSLTRVGVTELTTPWH